MGHQACWAPRSDPCKGQLLQPGDWQWLPEHLPPRCPSPEESSMTALWLCSHRGWGSHRETRALDAVLKADRQLPQLHSGPWWGRGGPDLQHAGQRLGDDSVALKETQGQSTASLLSHWTEAKPLDPSVPHPPAPVQRPCPEAQPGPAFQGGSWSGPEQGSEAVGPRPAGRCASASLGRPR